MKDKQKAALLRLIRNAEDTEVLSTLDEILGVSDKGETFEETSTRLTDEGDDDLAEIYSQMENRWSRFEEDDEDDDDDDDDD